MWVSVFLGILYSPYSGTELSGIPIGDCGGRGGEEVGRGSSAQG